MEIGLFTLNMRMPKDRRERCSGLGAGDVDYLLPLVAMIEEPYNSPKQSLGEKLKVRLDDKPIPWRATHIEYQVSGIYIRRIIPLYNTNGVPTVFGLLHQLK